MAMTLLTTGKLTFLYCGLSLWYESIRCITIYTLRLFFIFTVMCSQFATITCMHTKKKKMQTC